MDTLNIVRVVPDDDGNLIRKSKDDREFMQLEFEKPSQAGILSTAQNRFRNVWGAGGTVNAKADSLFAPLKKKVDEANEDGEFKQPIKVAASIQTIEIEPYYIPNEYGKEVHPETGESCNIAHDYTSIVFEDENIKSLARRNRNSWGERMVPKGEKASEAVEQEEVETTLSEELA